jgi:hypothetical protein
MAFPRSLVLVLAAAAVACAPRNESPAPARDYLYLWTASEDTSQADFLAVLDVTADTGRYGRLVTTLAVPARGSYPHHTEHELAPDRQLFANGFDRGRTWIFDLTTPDQPRIATEFGDLAGFSHPHSFVRLPNGNVLASFQMQHREGHVRTGGLVEVTPAGALVRSASADTPAADSMLRVYGSAVVPALDRIVTTTTDMNGDSDASRTLQFWRLSDLSLRSSITLPGPQGLLTAEPRLMQDGKTVLVSTFSCGLFLLEGIETDAPAARQVGSFPQKAGTNCAIPAIVGHYYLVTVPAWSAVVALDIADPAAPKEVSRVAFGPDDVPHWISVSPDQRRVVVTGYQGMQHRVELVRFDPATGALSLDERFREEGAATTGFRLDNKTWPHGGSAKGIPHGAVFSRP